MKEAICLLLSVNEDFSYFFKLQVLMSERELHLIYHHVIKLVETFSAVEISY